MTGGEPDELKMTSVPAEGQVPVTDKFVIQSVGNVVSQNSALLINKIATLKAQHDSALHDIEHRRMDASFERTREEELFVNQIVQECTTSMTATALSCENIIAAKDLECKRALHEKDAENHKKIIRLWMKFVRLLTNVMSKNTEFVAKTVEAFKERIPDDVLGQLRRATKAKPAAAEQLLLTTLLEQQDTQAVSELREAQQSVQSMLEQTDAK